ncbi:hypothetical protein J5J10_22080 [Ciceribacter sp. L1K23]|uniref:hypothetical protein n=1 Tax=Ciceribacter sp. L1K23 TaxID=2820276 RepID=UPI001B81DE99|nr:hypothetical protein [Ciceribacter sp. L1K23]MBR0558393.1 hypothetical protein [Ciceribacter sp. L1K23]
MPITQSQGSGGKPVTGQKSSIQDGSAHLFVPYNAGRSRTSSADDSRAPGAILRLGGYSSVEAAATDLSAFYPEHHMDSEGANALANASGPSSGGYRGGILLSCDGRMLLRAGEKFFLQSKSGMNIDTQSTLDITADKAIKVESQSTITIRSKNASQILIEALGGTATDGVKEALVTIKANKATKNIDGKDYEYIVDDKYTYTDANTYSIKYGNDTKFTNGISDSIYFGGTTSVFLGGAFSYTLSVALSIKTVDVVIYLAKSDIGLYKMDIVQWKTELKSGSLTCDAIGVKMENVRSALNAIEAKTGAITAISNGIDSVKGGIKSGLEGLASYTNGLTSYI